MRRKVISGLFHQRLSKYFLVVYRDRLYRHTQYRDVKAPFRGYNFFYAMEKQPENSPFEKRCACTQTLYTCAWETDRIDKCAASPPENKGDDIVILLDFRQNEATILIAPRVRRIGKFCFENPLFAVRLLSWNKMGQNFGKPRILLKSMLVSIETENTFVTWITRETRWQVKQETKMVD